MIRLFNIEWIKLKNYKTFWVLGGLYLFLITFIPISVLEFMKWLESKGVEFEEFSPSKIPILHFPDIWQNITYLSVFFKFFIAVIIIISITNEFSYKTIRQNIIDGLSRMDFLKSKLTAIVAICLISAVYLFLICLITGLIYTPRLIQGEILEYSQFIFAYFLDILFFLIFALLIGNTFKKAGISIALVVMIIPIEYIFSANLPDEISVVGDYLPMHVMNSIIQLPFTKYGFMEIQDYISPEAVALSFAYIALFVYLNYVLLKKRDLTS
ncbi:MAG TPA: ABC transporter permease [Cyclobacteriaceae bacterium]